MAEFTTKYHLEKPLQTENYDVDVFNGNADIIDGVLATKADLGEDGKVPPEQLPSGTAGGVATLDEDGKVPIDQIPELTYATRAQVAAAVNRVPYYTAGFAAVNNDWYLSNDNIPSDLMEFAVQTHINVNSANNQKVKVGSRASVPLKIGSQNVMANDIDVTGGSIEVTIKLNYNTGVNAAFLEFGGGGSSGGGGGVVQSAAAPTSDEDKNKLWFCTDSASVLYHTLNVWSGTAWVPVAGTFSA